MALSLNYPQCFSHHKIQINLEGLLEEKNISYSGIHTVSVIDR